MRRALIDGDLVAYRCAASTEVDSFMVARHYMESLIDQILRETESTEFLIALTGENNFRYQVYPEYKANRQEIQRPEFLEECKDYLHLQYDAIIADGCEADDILGIEQTKDIRNTIICSLDKDLRQVPGLHYSWEISGGPQTKRWTKEAEIVNVTHADGIKFFYYQLLVGDASDNIKGVAGIGKVKAIKILDALSNEQEFFETVRELYDNDDELLMNGQCLWIMRKEKEIWRFPTFETPIS